MAVFYKKPFIYLPKKQQVQSNKGQDIYNVGVPYYYNALSSVGGQLMQFYLTPHTTPTANAPELTLDGKKIFFNTVYTSTGTHPYMMTLKTNISDADIEKLMWTPRGRNSLVFPSMFLYMPSINTLYKLTFATTYRQQTYTGGFTITKPSGDTYVLGYTYVNTTNYKNLRDNATIVATIGSATNAMFYCFSQAFTDAEVLNIVQSFNNTPTATLVNLTI